MTKLTIFNSFAYRVDVDKTAKENLVAVSIRYGFNFMEDAYRILRFTNNVDRLTNKVKKLTETAMFNNWSDNGKKLESLNIRADAIEECVFVQVLLPRNKYQDSTVKSIIERALEKQVLPELEKMSLEISSTGF